MQLRAIPKTNKNPKLVSGLCLCNHDIYHFFFKAFSAHMNLQQRFIFTCCLLSMYIDDTWLFPPVSPASVLIFFFYFIQWRIMTFGLYVGVYLIVAVLSLTGLIQLCLPVFTDDTTPSFVLLPADQRKVTHSLVTHLLGEKCNIFFYDF